MDRLGTRSGPKPGSGATADSVREQSPGHKKTARQRPGGSNLLEGDL
jgi:hypothetical protein